MSKIALNTILAAIDKKDYGFYDRLDVEGRKQLAPFLLNRYVSLVKGNSELASYYLMATNQRVNSQYFELAKHPKLVWQLLCTVSPGMGTQFHQWLGNKKKDKNTSNKRKKYICEDVNSRNHSLDKPNDGFNVFFKMLPPSSTLFEVI
jgi:hypothetical protein